MPQLPKKKDVIAITMTENMRRARVPEMLAELVEETGLDRTFIAGIALREGLPLIRQDKKLLIKAPKPPETDATPTVSASQPSKLRIRRTIVR